MTPPPEAPTVTLPMSTFLTANGVPREWFVAASGAFATWLGQLGPDNTAPAALLHTLETLKAAQDENTELRRLLESARNWAVHLENQNEQLAQRLESAGPPVPRYVEGECCASGSCEVCSPWKGWD